MAGGKISTEICNIFPTKAKVFYHLLCTREEKICNDNVTMKIYNRIEFKKIPSVSIYIKVEGSQRTVDIYIN